MQVPPAFAGEYSQAWRDALERLVTSEIPIAGQMGVCVDEVGHAGLRVSMPLAINRNPHQTAFAGSLNALCTLAGWAATHVLLEQLDVAATIVIRRSSIKYHEPVEVDRVLAQCLPPREPDWNHFVEMIHAKGQAKLDHVVEVPGVDSDRPAVLFAGSYVATVISFENV